MIDRIGKGIRTAPRDALISQRSPCRGLATAFGVHRALDAAGAMLGPLVAFGVLGALPDAFDVLFVASFAIALVGVVAIVIFVPAKTDKDREVTSTPTSLRAAVALFVEPRFKVIVIVGSVLGVATMSDAFVFLVLQRRLGISAMVFPLLYVGTSLFTSVLSVPCGRLAESLRPFARPARRVRRARTGLLRAAAAGDTRAGRRRRDHRDRTARRVTTRLPTGCSTAMAAAVLPRRQSGSGCHCSRTATNGARLLASVAFGWLWTLAGRISPLSRSSARSPLRSSWQRSWSSEPRHMPAPSDTITLARAV